MPDLDYTRQGPPGRRGIIQWSLILLLFFVAVLTPLPAWLILLGPLVFAPRAPRSWELLRDWECAVNGHTLRIPAGFRFDLASVPRPLWIIRGFAPNEIGGTEAPLVHDFIYRHAGRMPPGTVDPPARLRRRDADRWFRQIMTAEGIGWLRRWAAWTAVRIVGVVPWFKARWGPSSGSVSR